MTAQTSLPGCAVAPGENRATLEQDLRGQVAICLMALFCWVEHHGGRTVLIDGTVERFIAASGTCDPQISRAIRNTRSVLARYLASGAAVPSWLPPSILELLQEPWCARDLAPSSETSSNDLPNRSPTLAPQSNIAPVAVLNRMQPKPERT